MSIFVFDRPPTRTTLAFELPIKTVSVLNLREHFRAGLRRKQQQRETVKMALWAPLAAYRCHPPSDRRPLRITITRISARGLDSDNLAASQKNVRDGIAMALGVDDGSSLLEWRYAQEKRTRSRKTAALPPYAVRIEIEAAT